MFAKVKDSSLLSQSLVIGLKKFNKISPCGDFLDFVAASNAG
jgi:hypothetical protein